MATSDFIEWLYFVLARNLAGQRSTELEIIAFLLSGFGLVTVASVYPHYALKQFIAILIGLAAFVILLALMRNTEVVNALHIPIAAGCVGLLALNLLLAKVHNGALNWINVGGISIQPSEIVKIEGKVNTYRRA